MQFASAPAANLVMMTEITQTLIFSKQCWTCFIKRQMTTQTFFLGLFKAMIVVVMRCENVYSVSHFFQGTANAHYQLLSSTCAEEVGSGD